MGDQPIVYLDHQATTPLDERIIESMLPYFTGTYGNPSSPHRIGRQAAAAVRRARRQMMDLIGAKYDSELIFTSGATEADNLAIRGVAQTLRGKGDHIITTNIEHKAVLTPCRDLARHGFEVTEVPVDREGIVAPTDIAAAIKDNTVLVSVMHANNEIGTVQALAEIGAITRDHDILLHTDAAQSLSSLPFDVAALGVDLASFSGHKVYGPKGVGALYVRRGSVRLSPQALGGGQEFGMRAGTLNVPGIVGLGCAATIVAEDRADESRRIGRLRDRMLARLLDELAGSRLNGSHSARLPGNISITVPGIDADHLISELSDLAISAGSACNTGQATISHVLAAIGLDATAGRSTLRISLGRPTTDDDVDFATERLVAHIQVGVSAARV